MMRVWERIAKRKDYISIIKMLKKYFLEKLPGNKTFFIIVSGLSLAVYLKTLCPDVFWYDSGELITACHTLGIPHNPGYPLYCLLGKLISLVIPWGTIALRVNLFSALCACLTVGIIYLVIVSFGLNRIIAAGCALCFAFTRVFWSQAVIAEVYTFHALFIAALILGAVKLSRGNLDKNSKWIIFTGLIFGLDLANHLSIILFLPGLIYIFLTGKNTGLKKSIQSILIFLLCLLPGLLFYLYLPLRSMHNPVLDWGNPETLKNFIAHVSGAQHRSTQVFSLSWLPVFARAGGLSKIYIAQFSFIGVILSLWGGYRMFRQNSRLAVFLIWIIFAETFFALFLNTVSLEATPFGLPVYLVLVLFIALGLGDIYVRFRPGRIFLLIILISPLIFLKVNFRSQNKTDYYWVKEYGNEIIDYIREPAVIITSSDNNLFPLLYLQHVENKMGQTLIISKELITSKYTGDWYLKQLEAAYLGLSSESFDKVEMKNIIEDDESGILKVNGFSKDPVINRIIQDNIDRFRIYVTSTDIARAEYLLPWGPVFLINPEPVETLDDDSNGLKYYWCLANRIYNLENRAKLDAAARQVYADLFNNAGAYYYRRKMVEGALFCYRVALIIQPDHAIAYCNQKLLLKQTGNNE